MRARSVVTLLTWWFGVAGLSATVHSQSSESSWLKALRFFESVSAGGADASLRALRPPPISPSEHGQALALLPEAGELQPRWDEREKLALIRPVLVYHERVEVFDIKLIDLPQAAVGLYGRAVVLISRPAVRLLSGKELQALVAHEIGHEYFWPAFEVTRERGDRQGRHELEFKCDGVAVLTLVALGLDPAPLMDGIRKLTVFNESVGAMANADDYPRLQDRERFVRALRGLPKAQ